MSLNLARGDVTQAMLDALRDSSRRPEFRADVVDLLLKRNFRCREERIEQALLRAARDSQAAVRRRVVAGVPVYAQVLAPKLTHCLADEDPEVRRQAYLVFGGPGYYDEPERGLWEKLSPEVRQEMIQECRRRARSEQDAELALLARAVVGREIAARCSKAIQAVQTSDMEQAERLLLGALELDGENRQAQACLVRFYLKCQEKQKAMDLARRLGVLIEVPALPAEPVIDGDPTDEVWAKAWQTDTFYQASNLWVQRRTEGRSKAFLGHRDGVLYVAVIGYEKDLGQLVRRETRRDGKEYEDDCVELLLDPDITEKDYYQFVINSLDGLYDKFNRDKDRNFKCRYKSGLFADRGYWAVEFAIKGTDLDNHPIGPGTMWSLCVFRTRIGPASEIGGIWPTFGQTARLFLYPLAVFQ